MKIFENLVKMEDFWDLVKIEDFSNFGKNWRFMKNLSKLKIFEILVRMKISPKLKIFEILDKIEDFWNSDQTWK